MSEQLQFRYADEMEVPSKYLPGGAKQGYTVRLGASRFATDGGFDYDLVKKVWQAMRDGKIPSNVMPEAAQFAAISSFQPAARTSLPYMLSYFQGTYIGDELLPTLFAGPDEKYAWPEIDYSKFFVDPKLEPIGILGSVPMNDFTITWHTNDINVYSEGVPIDRRTRDAGVTLPSSTDAIAGDLVTTLMETKKEYAQAAFVTNTSNYLNSSYYTTNAGTTLWGDPSARPINQFVDADETIRQGPARVRADIAWFSPYAFAQLRVAEQILQAVKYTGTQGVPGSMVPIETIVALLGKSVVIGDAGATTTPDGTPTDIWGHAAGLICSGRGRILGVRFGFTARSDKYPVFRVVPMELVGGLGSDAVIDTDAWRLEGVKNSAGYLWTVAA